MTDFQGAVPKTLQIKKSTKINNGKRKLITIINNVFTTNYNQFTKIFYLARKRR